MIKVLIKILIKILMKTEEQQQKKKCREKMKKRRRERVYIGWLDPLPEAVSLTPSLIKSDTYHKCVNISEYVSARQTMRWRRVSSHAENPEKNS